MRTTLQIDDDILAAAKEISKNKNDSIGSVISELARKGLNAKSSYPKKGGTPVFMVKENAKKISLEDVKRAEDED